MKIQWYINPEGSYFTFEQLFPVLTWCLYMVSLVSTHEFRTVLKTNARPGEQPRGAKLLSFAPKEEFSNQTDTANADNGAKFNTRYSLSLFVLGAVLLHEITHGWEKEHDELNTDTIMSTVRLFGSKNRSLLYPKDIVAINTLPFGAGITTPKNVCVADELMRLMVPAVALGELQHWVLLEHVEGRLLEVKKTSAFGAYPPAAVAFENPCTFKNNILTLGDVHTPGGIVPNVELKWLGDGSNLLEWKSV